MIKEKLKLATRVEAWSGWWGDGRGLREGDFTEQLVHIPHSLWFAGCTLLHP